VESCAESTFFDEDSETCEACLEECLTCDGPERDNCLSCKDKYFSALSQECLEECPAGYYEEHTTMECTLCESPCEDCGDSATDCTKCYEGSELPFQYKGACIEECAPEVTIQVFSDLNGN